MTTLLLIPLLAATVLAQAQPLQLRVTMISLGVAEPARSIKFYGETLGLQMVGKPGEVTLFRAGEVTIVLNQPAAQGNKGPLAGVVEVIFPADSVAASYKDLSDRGCKFVQQPHEVTPGMWAATFTDPDGHQLTILGGR